LIPKKATDAIDQFFTNRIKSDKKLAAAWIQGVELLHDAGIILPEGAQSCDAIFEELTGEALQS
jgi:hypothetical protein